MNSSIKNFLRSLTERRSGTCAEFLKEGGVIAFPSNAKESISYKNPTVASVLRGTAPSAGNTSGGRD